MSFPVAAVQVLLPAWGFNHIKRLLNFCIPTLLAPGNVPALAARVSTKFVLLTRKEDVPFVETHPAWQSLAEWCLTEIRLIDDLITRDNHTAVITLAFHRAILEAGPARSDTCFFFMNSDFLIADGSLLSAFGRFQKGATGLLAGNFQIVEEDMVELLRPHIDAGRALALSPRELLSLSFAHLHPATIANIVNLGLAHNSGSNRLFWRVDQDTLLGRFYLIHVVAIRPEQAVEHVSSSYDYSFIPEMCPSGRVDTITDSDEYLAVEMQARDHEAGELRTGPLTPEVFGESISKWATAQHRSTSRHNVYFHSKQIPKADSTIEAADQFIEAASSYICAEPAPFRDHPYWKGSITAHLERLGRPMESHDWKYFIDAPKYSRSKRVIGSAMKGLLGEPPQVTVIHPLWKDYSIISESIEKMNENENESALLVALRPSLYRAWLVEQDRVRSFELQTLMTLLRSSYLPLVNKFDLALLFITPPTVSKARAAVARIGPLLRPGGRLLVMIDGPSLRDHAAATLTLLANMDLHLETVRYHVRSRMKAMLQRALESLGGKGQSEDETQMPSFLACLAAIPVTAVVGLMNQFGTSECARGEPGALYSSVVLGLRRSQDPAPMRLPDDLDRPILEQSVAIETARVLAYVQSCLSQTTFKPDGNGKYGESAPNAAVGGLTDAAAVISDLIRGRDGR